MEDIFSKIELLREKLHEVALEKGMAHPDVLDISQKLDNIINEFYKMSY